MCGYQKKAYTSYIMAINGSTSHMTVYPKMLSESLGTLHSFYCLILGPNALNVPTVYVFVIVICILFMLSPQTACP